MGMLRRRLLALVAAGATLGGVGAVTAQAATPARSAKSAGTTLKLSAKATALKFDVARLTAKPGRVTLVMSNPSSISHDIALKGNGLKPVVGKIVGKGRTSTITATLKNGSYEFYCSVPGHEAAGMKGTLKVT
jgi:plastocyanin